MQMIGSSGAKTLVEGRGVKAKHTVVTASQRRDRA